MYDLEKCIVVTNNDRAAARFEGRVMEICLLETYREVLEKTRDFIHAHRKLLTHPQASSLKPNQTPYRTILLYSEGERDNTGDVILIENALESFDKWSGIRQTQTYDEKIANDYKTIDLSMIENVIARL